MATLADELQNDFADSGSERGDEDENEVANKVTGLAPKSVFDSLYEEDEDDNMEANEDGDIEPKETLLDEAEEEEEARLQAETASQRDHKDMRGVASFMKSMEPILEVSTVRHPQPHTQETISLHPSNFSPDSRYLPAGYQEISVAFTRGARSTHWQYRRPCRIPSSYKVQLLLDIDRRRENRSSQVHPRPLLCKIPRA